MLQKIIHRPIAVTMCLIALFVMGMLALQLIPVSLMPDIDIPQITVHANMPGFSAQEVEQDVISPLRGRLMQVAGVKNIRSESRTDAGTVVMTFEPGSNINLLFIEVNEKIDRAMNSMPKEMERPKVMKASAMDIPAFYLDIYLTPTDSSARNNSASLRFAELGRFARGVVSKRIEQMPQTAMVDLSGTVGTEIVCIPDYEKLRSIGLSVNEIEKSIARNNITLEALSVVDGLYRYNIHFDSQLLTKEDVASIYINHNGRMLQLRDLCRIEERIAQRNGIVRHGSHNAITLAVIKQNDAQMEDLQEGVENLLKELRKEYPEITFELTRDQTRLLTYTIDNLHSNLYIGALMACLVLFLFMRQWRLSLLVVLSVPLSLLLTLLCFYTMGISFNIISLSGLILGVGMIVDNSIIVIDNIMQRWHGGMPLREAVLAGTKEVFAPMLSSVLTTCSVFLPLIFLSGIAGALFYDQAMGVTIALFASLLVAVFVIPVYFYAFFSRKKSQNLQLEKKQKTSILGTLYEKIMKWVLRHAIWCLVSMLCIVPLIGYFFSVIEKERMPYIEKEDILMVVDWNAGISADENDRRLQALLLNVQPQTKSSTTMAGTQEFMLSHTKDITPSEAVVYLEAHNSEALDELMQKTEKWMQKNHPTASLTFEEPGNIYAMMFSTDESDLEIHLQDDEGRRPEVAESRAFIDTLQTRFPNIAFKPVVTETNIRYVADMQQMAAYKVSFETLYSRLKELVSRKRVFEINDGANSVPVVVGVDHKDELRVLASTVRNEEGTEIPISYLLRETKGEDYKRLQAGNGGGFYSIDVNASDREVEQVMEFVEEYVRRPQSKFSASFAGGYFSSRQMIGELTVVLCVALALLYFILAAQFESFVQPFIILLEMVVDVFFVVFALWMLGETLNVMSMIGLVVMSGIIINDSILKVDTINRLRHGGSSLLRSVLCAGQSRLRPIIMTSLTTILGVLPFLQRSDMGSALQYPLSLTIIIGLTVGTFVSLFLVPMIYYIIYKIVEK